MVSVSLRNSLRCSECTCHLHHQYGWHLIIRMATWHLIQWRPTSQLSKASSESFLCGMVRRYVQSMLSFITAVLYGMVRRYVQSMHSFITAICEVEYPSDKSVSQTNHLQQSWYPIWLVITVGSILKVFSLSWYSIWVVPVFQFLVHYLVHQCYPSLVN